MDGPAKDFLFDLLNTPSPTGFELAGQRKWAAYVRPFVHEVTCDAYGTAYASIEGRGGPGTKAIMFEAHADEIGYIVKHVTKEGFLHVDRIGGSDIATARGRRLEILGDKGSVRGIIGNTAIHLRRDEKDEKAPKVHDLYVDVGASTPLEVHALGIRVGHPAVYTDRVEEFGNERIVSRAIDNRIGGFILAQVMATLSQRRDFLKQWVHAVNAVQEEIGGHGAKMAAYRLRPSVAIVLDVTHATDTPGIDHAQHGEVRLGAGPSITHGTCNHPLVVKRLLECAERLNITIQHESSSRYSGTDTDVIFNTAEGIPSALVSLPLRYMHSVVEMADLADVQKIIDLLVAFAESIEDTDDFHIRL